MVSNVTLRQSTSSGGTLTYEVDHLPWYVYHLRSSVLMNFEVYGSTRYIFYKMKACLILQLLRTLFSFQFILILFFNSNIWLQQDLMLLWITLFSFPCFILFVIRAMNTLGYYYTLLLLLIHSQIQNLTQYYSASPTLLSTSAGPIGAILYFLPSFSLNTRTWVFGWSICFCLTFIYLSVIRIFMLIWTSSSEEISEGVVWKNQVPKLLSLIHCF